MKTCETCRYHDRGQCKRFPPIMVPWPRDNQHPIMYEPATTWPLVEEDDWCGEYSELMPPGPRLDPIA